MELKTSCSALLLHKLSFWFAKSSPQQLPCYFGIQTYGVCVLVPQLCLTLCDLMDYIARQAHLSMGFFRQEYWSGLPFPSPGDLSNQGIEPRSPALQAESFLSEPPGKPTHIYGESLLKQ